MKIIKANSVGLTVQFSFRELALLNTILYEFKDSFESKVWKDCRLFCTVFLRKLSDHDSKSGDTGG